MNKEDVQGLSHAKVIGMLRKITGTVELEINRYYSYQFVAIFIYLFSKEGNLISINTYNIN